MCKSHGRLFALELTDKWHPGDSSCNRRALPKPMHRLAAYIYALPVEEAFQVVGAFRVEA